MFPLKNFFIAFLLHRHLHGSKKLPCYTGTHTSRPQINLSMARTLAHTQPRPYLDVSLDWMDFNIDLPELTYRRSSGHALMSKVFLSLGNTGTATHRLWTGNTLFANMSAPHQTSRIKTASGQDKVPNLLQLRHPDPSLTAKLEVKSPSCRCPGRGRNSTSRLHLRSSCIDMACLALFGKASPNLSPPYHLSNLPPFSVGRHYIGGWRRAGLGPYHRDLWCLDLTKLDGWRSLPPHPKSADLTGIWVNLPMHVLDNKAYLFTGRPNLNVFDLVSETWRSLKTTYTPTLADKREGGADGDWPWPGNVSSDAAQVLTRGRLFVFGGSHGKTKIGCNLFLELDLKTLVWRRLSGYVIPPPDNDYSCLGPRKEPAAWVRKDKERIYVLFGQCDRNGAHLNGELHGASSAYALEDMWSWDIKVEKWIRERLAGNPPCPRAEMACTYVCSTPPH